jgi:hypothetical protein
MRVAAALVSLLWAAPASAAAPTNLIATGRTDTQLHVRWDGNGNTFFTLDYLGPEFFGGIPPTCDTMVPVHNNVHETISDQVIVSGLQPLTWYHVHAIGEGEDGRTNDMIVRTAASGAGFEALSFGSPDYLVCASGGGDGSGFTDGVLTPGFSVVRAVHVTELRARIDALRVMHALAAFAWTDSDLTAGVSDVKAVHVMEMRTALSEAYTAAAGSQPVYTDPALAPGTTIKAVHIAELRGAVLALE